MNCKKIQELLITDYPDNQLTQKERKTVEEHLSACQTCREYESIVRSTVMQPFENAERLQPHQDFIWTKIKEKIRKEEKPVFGFLGRILPKIYFPKPAFALSTIAALTVALFFVGRMNVTTQTRQENTQLAKAAIEDQITYFANGNGSDESISFGTSIEEYFL